MIQEQVKDFILQEKLVVLFRRVPVEKMGELAKALVRGGVKILEVTFDQEAENPSARHS